MDSLSLPSFLNTTDPTGTYPMLMCPVNETTMAEPMSMGIMPYQSF